MQPTQANIRTKIAYLLNDTAQALYTNTVIDPAIEQAYFELQSEYQNNGIGLNIFSNIVITVPASTPAITITGAVTYPASLVWPIQLWEGPDDGTSAYNNPNFIPMNRVLSLMDLPKQGINPGENIGSWAWETQTIWLPLCGTQKRVIVKYVSDFAAIGPTFAPINSFVFLTYRAAAIASMVIGSDPERAQALNDGAQAELEKLVNINVQANQLPTIRRRPYSIKRRWNRWL